MSDLEQRYVSAYIHLNLPVMRKEIHMAIEKFSVSRDDSIYHAWPDLVLTRGGKLICVFTECTHHKNRNSSRIMITESTDRGRSWSPKRPLTETSDASFYFNNSRISRLPDDSLAIICDRVDSTGKGECGPRTCQYIWQSDPEGLDFGEPRILPLCGIVPDKYRVLSNGRILIVAHSKNFATGQNEQYLWYSDDGGDTWSDRVTIGADPRYNLCEGSVLELGGGVLVCFMRENSKKGLDCFKAISRDFGASWEGVYTLPIPGCHRPVSGKLKDGRILLTYRFLQGGAGWMGHCTQNTFAAVFSEETALEPAREKQSVRIMPLDYDRSANSDLGYTGWVQFDDEEIYIVNYIVDDAPKAQIRGYSLYPSDILLG